MPLGLGRIDPARGATDVRDAGGPSPQLLRELHADLVRQKRLGFLKASPLLILAGFAYAAALPDVRAYGGLLMFAAVTALAVGQIGYQWLTLRRADPLALYEREQREADQQRLDREDHAARAAGVRPVVTIALVTLISVVTVVQFLSGSFLHTLQAAALVKADVRAGQWWRLLTATYLHGSLFHLSANMSALLALGNLVEIYDRRWRVPLVYLVAAIGGSLLSTFATRTTSVGASGGVIGLAGYLFVLARAPGAPPAWIQRKMSAILASTALLGLAAFSFVDNGAHLGGALAGAGLGFAIRGHRHRRRLTPTTDAAGAIAGAILIVGALFTIVRLVS